MQIAAQCLCAKSNYAFGGAKDVISRKTAKPLKKNYYKILVKVALSPFKISLTLEPLLLITPSFHNPKIFLRAVQWGFVLIRFLLNDKIGGAARFAGQVNNLLGANQAFA